MESDIRKLSRDADRHWTPWTVARVRPEVPLATGGIHRDFEAHVLADLIKHKCSMHGCPVYAVQSKLDGGVAVRFKGPRDGVEWEGGLKFTYPLLKDKKWLGDTTAVVETILQLAYAATQASKGQSLIERASVH